MSRRHADLEARLVEWGREYGGGRYDNIGWAGKSPLLTLMTYHGPAPQGLNPRNRKDRTPADEVQQAVDALAKQRDGYLPSEVLQAEYFTHEKPVEQKIQMLKAIGCYIGSVQRYSQLLRLGRIHVAGWLRMPFSDELGARELQRDVVGLD